jgi:hypothetical protein
MSRGLSFNSSFPKNAINGLRIGEDYSTTSNSRYFMAVFFLTKHHIFMHTLAGLRYRNTGCSDARCFAASPYAFTAVSSE